MLAGPTRESIGLVIADVADRQGRIDRTPPTERYRKPAAIDLAPISGRLPALRFDRCPTVRQPQSRIGIATVGHEFEPLAIADPRSCEPHRLEKDLVRRLFIIETETAAPVPNGVNADERRTLHITHRDARPLRPLPLRIVGWICFVKRKCMQDIG